MKHILFLFVVLAFVVTGCSEETRKEDELQKVVQIYTDSMIEKDADTHKTLYEEGVIDVEMAFKGNNFFSFETVHERVEGNEAVNKLKCNFEELQASNEYQDLIGYVTLTLRYDSGGWLIKGYETELDPSTPRPPRP